MIKNRAGALLYKRVFRSFLPLFFAAVISLSGLAIFGVAIWLYNSEKLGKTLSGVFGKNASFSALPVTVLICVFGLLVFSFGKKRSAMFVCKRALNGIFSSDAFSFLLYIAVRTLYTLCWGFICLLPSVICAVSLFVRLSSSPVERNVFAVWAAGSASLFLTGLGFLFVILQRYSAWKYYLCRKKYGVISSLYKCLEKTEGRAVKIALFKLSMLGWILSCLAVFPAVYVLPYYELSTALFILEGENENQESKEYAAARFNAVFQVIREQ